MKGNWYAAYAEATAAEAAALFELKYGYPPAEIVDGQTILLAGPIKEKESDERTNSR